MYNAAMRILITVLLLLVSACASRSNPYENMGATPLRVHLNDELASETAIYREQLATNYLFLVGKYNAKTDANSVLKATEVVGELKGWKLFFDGKGNRYVLVPWLVQADEIFAINAELEIKSLQKNERSVWKRKVTPTDIEVTSFLREIFDNQNASEGLIVQQTEIWRKFLNVAVFQKADEVEQHFMLWELKTRLSAFSPWYFHSGEFEVLNDRINYNLWGVLPKWGWVAVSIDRETLEVTIEHNDMAFE